MKYKLKNQIHQFFFYRASFYLLAICLPYESVRAALKYQPGDIMKYISDEAEEQNAQEDAPKEMRDTHEICLKGMILMISATNQSFNVDDIRRLRDEIDKTRGGMSAAELTLSISECAGEGIKILDELKRKKVEFLVTLYDKAKAEDDGYRISDCISLSILNISGWVGVKRVPRRIKDITVFAFLSRSFIKPGFITRTACSFLIYGASI